MLFWEKFLYIKTQIKGNENQGILANYVLNNSYIHLPQKTLLYLTSLTYKENESIRIAEFLLDLLNVKCYSSKTIYKALYTISYLIIHGSEFFTSLICTYEWKFHQFLQELETEDMRLKTLSFQNKQIHSIPPQRIKKEFDYPDETKSSVSPFSTTPSNNFDFKLNPNIQTLKMPSSSDKRFSNDMNQKILRSKMDEIIPNEEILLCQSELNCLLHHLKNADLVPEIKGNHNGSSSEKEYLTEEHKDVFSSLFYGKKDT